MVELKYALLLLTGALIAMTTPAHAAPPIEQLPEPPVLSPTALRADAGDGRIFLRWNEMIEDPRVKAFRIEQVAPNRRTVVDRLERPHHVVTGVDNGTTYEFTVVGLLADGRVTPPSNVVRVVPSEVGTAKVERLGGEVDIAGRSVDLRGASVRVTFPDGQQLVYDQLRPIDWRARDGRHLITPGHFGNGLDIGRFDNRGFAFAVPPEEAPAARLTHSDVRRDQIDADGMYRHPQYGAAHAYLVDPVTLPLGVGKVGRFNWHRPEVDGDRVTFHYWQPIEAMGFKRWNMVLVWETWWPIERERFGTTYHGLARLIEVKMPSAWTDGYSVMLNNGFGPNGGSRKSVMSYDTGFRNPGVEIVDYSGDTNTRMVFKNNRAPRTGRDYHPDQEGFQSHPIIFYEFPDGSMTVTVRSMYFHGSHMSSTYIDQGVDGVWPNLAWDIGRSGERIAVETVEYLYAPKPDQPLPQRFLNARWDALYRVADRMGTQDRLAGTNKIQRVGHVPDKGGPMGFAEHHIEQGKRLAIDCVGAFHDFWHAVPATVDHAYRIDPDHDVNPLMKRMCDRLTDHGMHPGFWFRPEFVKTSMLNVLSDQIPTASTYYGYSSAKYPDVVSLLERRGIPVARDHTDWIRLQRDGAWPVDTPYDWVPMSLATDWWDQIMWPTLKMSADLGFQWMLQDGGQGGMQGVEYAPMLQGRARTALASQPFYWRVMRTAEHLGLKYLGECTIASPGAYTNFGGPGDEHFIWMFHASHSNAKFPEPAQMHRLYQLYNNTSDHRGDADFVAVRRFARRFFESHDPPQWIELKDLRQTDPIEVTLKPGQSPVAGDTNEVVTDAGTITLRIRPWVWSDAIWHYADGTTAVYPAYDRVNWQEIENTE